MLKQVWNVNFGYHSSFQIILSGFSPSKYFAHTKVKSYCIAIEKLLKKTRLLNEQSLHITQYVIIKGVLVINRAEIECIQVAF